MNLDRYRSSFTVYVAISDVKVGWDVALQLEQAGYYCELRLNLETLNEEILKNPPHMIVMAYGDKHFFATDGVYKGRLEALMQMLPEVQIIFVTEKGNLASCANLYEYGIYDCVQWPLEHSGQLLRAVDRAAEKNYYMYLNEHLKEKSDTDNSLPGRKKFDPAIYQVWLKELETVKGRDEAIQLFMKEAMRYLRIQEAYFLKYRDIHHTLAMSTAFGPLASELEGVGIDLAAHEPGFVPSLLAKPQALYSIQEFVKKGLERKHALILPLFYADKCLGVFIFAASHTQVFRDEDQDDSYLATCLIGLKRQFEIQELKERLNKLTVFDFESEAYNSESILGKLKEEVVRARRLLRPVSTLVMQIDGFADLTLVNSNDTNRLFLKSFTEILKKHSRVNDLIGRASLDQFVICLPHTDWRGAIVKAERIRRTIESANFSEVLGLSEKMTVSIGVSEYPTICHDADELLRTAESALAEVKRTTRNRVNVAVAPPRFVPDFVVKNDKPVSSVAG